MIELNEETYLWAMGEPPRPRDTRIVFVEPGEPKRIRAMFLGSHPVGIVSGERGIAFAAYWEPSICLVSPEQEGGVSFQVQWINWAGSPTGEDVRLFPNNDVLGRHNRAQTVNFGPENTLWVTRNTGHEFFMLVEAEGRWHLNNTISVPREKPDAMIHSALVDGETIYTVESTTEFEEPWELCVYERPSHAAGPITLQAKEELPPWTYGIAKREESLWFVADWRRSEAGIFRKPISGGQLEVIVPDVRGNGLCFLPDGSALVAVDGHPHPSALNGIPGALLYVPARLLS